MNEVDTRICSNQSPICIHMICIYFLNSTCLQNVCIWVSIHGWICHWTLTPDYVKQLIPLFRVSPFDICIVRATVYLRLHTYNSCRKKGSYLEPNYSSLKEPLPLGEWLQTLRKKSPLANAEPSYSKPSFPSATSMKLLRKNGPVDTVRTLINA